LIVLGAAGGENDPREVGDVVAVGVRRRDVDWIPTDRELEDNVDGAHVVIVGRRQDLVSCTSMAVAMHCPCMEVASSTLLLASITMSTVKGSRMKSLASSLSGLVMTKARLYCAMRGWLKPPRSIRCARQ